MGFFLYTKIMFKCEDDFWNRVRQYKRDKGFETLNATVRDLIEQSLIAHEQKKQSVYQTH